MQNYKNSSVFDKWYIKMAVSILISILVMFLLTILSSYIIYKTNVSETFEGLFMIIITAVISILLTTLLIFSIQTKGINCSLMAMAVITILKISLSLVINNKVSFSVKGIVNLLFIMLFCFFGGMLGSYIKNSKLHKNIKI